PYPPLFRSQPARVPQPSRRGRSVGLNRKPDRPEGTCPRTRGIPRPAVGAGDRAVQAGHTGATFGAGDAVDGVGQAPVAWLRLPGAAASASAAAGAGPAPAGRSVGGAGGARWARPGGGTRVPTRRAGLPATMV